MKPEALTLERLTSKQIAPLDKATGGDFPESLREFAQSHFVTLLRRGCAPEEAATLAADLARGIGRDLGGTQPYISSGSKDAKRARNAEIARDFNGCNGADLARKYNLSERAIYTVLRMGSHSRSRR